MLLIYVFWPWATASSLVQSAAKMLNYLTPVRNLASTTRQVFISHDYFIWVFTRVNTEAVVCICIATRKTELTFSPEQTAQNISQVIMVKCTSKRWQYKTFCFMWHRIERHVYKAHSLPMRLLAEPYIRYSIAIQPDQWDTDETGVNRRVQVRSTLVLQTSSLQFCTPRYP